MNKQGKCQKWSRGWNSEWPTGEAEVLARMGQSGKALLGRHPLGYNPNKRRNWPGNMWQSVPGRGNNRYKLLLIVTGEILMCTWRWECRATKGTFCFITNSCSCFLATNLSPTLCDPMDCSLPGSTIHGISQERILEWVAISFSRGSSQELNLCLLHCRWTLYHLATRETPTVTPYSVKAGNSIESWYKYKTGQTLWKLVQQDFLKAECMSLSPKNPRGMSA